MPRARDDRHRDPDAPSAERDRPSPAPSAAPPAAAVLALQRTAGNAATQRILSRDPTAEAEATKRYHEAIGADDYEEAVKQLSAMMVGQIIGLLAQASPQVLVGLLFAAFGYPALGARIAAAIEAAAAGSVPAGAPQTPAAPAEAGKAEAPPAAPVPAAPAPAAPAPAAPAAETKFKTQTYTMSDKAVTLVKEVKDKKGVVTKAKIEETPATYTAAILEKALGKKEADAWYSNFTTIRFLNQAIGDPIHIDLAKHLKGVERKMADKYGGPSKDPKVAGETLGLNETIAGGRSHPTSAGISMHLFGLAIDVNYTANPFIAQSKNKKKQPRDNEVFERAGLLVRRDGSAKFKSGMSYDELAALDKILEDYFALISDETKLAAALKDNPHDPWKGLDAAAAKKKIEEDLVAVTGRWERRKKSKAGKDTEVIEKGGFMDLDKRFVEEIGLSWGASYGDIMHFDMRNTGNGAKIQKAVQEYKKEKEEEALKKAQDAQKAAGG